MIERKNFHKSVKFARNREDCVINTPKIGDISTAKLIIAKKPGFMCMALHTAEVLANQAYMISRGAIQVAVSKSSPDPVVTTHSSKIAVICTMKGEDSLAGASLSLDYV